MLLEGELKFFSEKLSPSNAAATTTTTVHFSVNNKYSYTALFPLDHSREASFSKDIEVAMRPTGVIEIAMLLSLAIFILYITINPPQQALKTTGKLRHLFVPSKRIQKVQETPKVIHHKCGLPEECHVDHFAFHLRTGAANVIGPKICFEDEIIMSSVKNNIGPGLNIVLINAETGKILKFESFNLYSKTPDSADFCDSDGLLAFLKDLKPGTIVLVASFDEPTSNLSDEAREVFVSLGSTWIKSLRFRDGWVFAGAAGMAEKSPFEKYIKNDSKKNIYGGWPEVLELSGCFPRKL
ncbi:hypothetical protein GJAV_G00193040 [Gymnothorax javanicus]|nr:hypothetical protein GJAV_G00193040 [Gymnothorax javanicus]